MPTIKINFIFCQHVINNIIYIPATLLLFSSGSALGWTSPALPKLLNEETAPILITPDEGSWIVVAIVVGTIVAPPMAALMMDT